MKKNTVRVYTDGACKGNPGPGGFGVRIRYPGGRVTEFGGREKETTNNRMELRAVIEGLRRTRRESRVLVVTDSEYVRQGITQWIHDWKDRDWTRKDGKPVSNRDLWMALDRLLRPGVSFTYTAGHAGDPDNERCDAIASAFAQGRAVTFREGVDPTPPRPPARRTQAKGRRVSGRKGPGVYLSYVDGCLRRHETWAECERVVKGVSGARFKKCRTEEEVEATLRQWGLAGEEAPGG